MRDEYSGDKTIVSSLEKYTLTFDLSSEEKIDYSISVRF